MLVTLQRTGDERRLPAAAEHLVAVLRSWGPGPDHLTGLALTGITVPSRLGPRPVDALVFTRSGVVVIAAGLSPGAGERAGAGVAAAKGALAAHDGGRYVTGLVAVVPVIQGDGRGAPEPDETGVAAVPDPREPVAESRWRGGAESARRGADAGGSESERAWRGVGSAGRAPDQRGADRGGLESDQAWRGVDSVGRAPDERQQPGADASGSASERAWLDAGSPDQAQLDADAGKPGPGPAPEQAWREPGPADSDLPWLDAGGFPGVAVVLADSRGLRRIIGQHNRWRTVWSADDVLDACYALSLAHLAPPRAALLADGFPVRLPAFERVPELPAVVALPSEPPPRVEDDPGPRVRVSRGQAVPRPRPIRQVPWGFCSCWSCSSPWA
ncbi:hypothetical protein OG738_33535 [Amycolatopsis sp. NBC_01488]|uniref:hypothetical protein n=1 Tax=Amycolatopsis sp. NBC_01488 TaxID=2903563 RepID=UPI002E2A85FD|nr:hypothetical protein [Amycolatopsis sp. NBC_01488]